jgi:gluconate 2-dehydrogenase gamma chain
VTSRKEFIKIGVAAVAGAAVAGGGVFGLLSNPLADSQKKVSDLQQQVSNLQQKLTGAQGDLATANQQVGSLQTAVDTTTGFLTLNTKEQAVVEAIAETIIPTDSLGPGAKEAGVIYFIDNQLAGDYGHSGNMYTKGPFVAPNQKSQVTVQGITYTGGSAIVRQGAGTRYQYSKNLREFWRVGLQYLENYSQSAYGDQFESLAPDKRAQVLTDVWNNKPTSSTFPDIIPQDFFAEVHDMAIMGFFSDPLYGGNKGMVGWILAGHNGVNQGNAFGEGFTTAQLMVMDKPTRLKPLSLGQLQKAGK